MGYTIPAGGGVTMVSAVGADGFANGNRSYSLASNVASLAAGNFTTPVSGIMGGSYVWAYQFAGTTPSLQLESLGPDGVNYLPIGAAVTASGSTGVVIGSNATVRLRNTGSNAITGLSSNLS